MTDLFDPVTRHRIADDLQRLHDEFRGVFSEQTIDRYVAESTEALSGARVQLYVPIFVHRFARERLLALAQAEGRIAKEVPEVLFVCVHNSGRSQMAAALLTHYSAGRVHVRSAGSAPTDEILPTVVHALMEVGIDLKQEFPKPLTNEVVRAADAVITMGCGDACPIYPGKRYEDWEVVDPAGRSLEEVRTIRSDIDHRVRVLLEELLPGEVSVRPA
ncbi:MAG TPA: arsenate reductase ArsC [Candidatus Dormibacteraeota bacterium]